MTNAYAADQGSVTIEFHDLVLIDAGATYVYGCTVDGVDLRFEVVADPTARELLDAALHAYKAEVASSVRDAVDEGRS